MDISRSIKDFFWLIILLVPYLFLFTLFVILNTLTYLILSFTGYLIFIYEYLFENNMEKDIKAKITLEEILETISARLGHLEDIEADNRALIVKMIKQGNTIVEFLRGSAIEVTEELLPQEEFLSVEKTYSSGKIKDIKELVDEFMTRREELKELEEELQKHKDKITPGEIGEA